MKIFIPNEIFDDLKNEINSFSHTAFAYAYHYYITYLYRCCLFVDGEKVTQKEIKAKLGYSPSEKRLDYMIKKDGVLDKMGYTKTTKDYPIAYEYDEDDQIQFITNLDARMEAGAVEPQRNYKIKYPIKSFHRTSESYTEQLLDGTFYHPEDTHGIDNEIFDEMMKDKELGVGCFYIYAFIKSKCGIYGCDYQAPYSKMIEGLNIKSYETFTKYVKLLEDRGYIGVNRINHPNNREANLYKIK